MILKNNYEKLTQTWQKPFHDYAGYFLIFSRLQDNLSILCSDSGVGTLHMTFPDSRLPEGFAAGWD